MVSSAKNIISSAKESSKVGARRAGGAGPVGKAR